MLGDAFTSVYRGPQSISCECLCIAATRTHQVEVRTSSQELSDKAERNESRGDPQGPLLVTVVVSFMLLSAWVAEMKVWLSSS